MKSISINCKQGEFEVKLSDKDFRKIRNLSLGVKTISGSNRSLCPYVRIYDKKINKYRQIQLSSYLFAPENFNGHNKRIFLKDRNPFNLMRSNIEIK
jgi:hypothetical protein